MSIHSFPLEKYSMLVKSTMSFKKTFDEITDVRLEIQEGPLQSFKVLDTRNQELESHSINSQMQCWQKERAELWFKILCKSQIKRFKVEFKSEEHCGTIIAILEKFGIETKRSPQVLSESNPGYPEPLSTQAFIQEDSQILPTESLNDYSQPMIQEEQSMQSQILIQDSLSPFRLSQSDPPFKNWKYSPLMDEDVVGQTPASVQSSISQSNPSGKSNPSPIIPNTNDAYQPSPIPADALVERVLAKRRVDGTLQYLIKWSGISKEFATWKDYSSTWSLEDQEKALTFEKSLLDELVVDQDDEIIPYVLDLDLIRYLVSKISNTTLQKWVEIESKSTNIACIISNLEPEKEKWKAIMSKIF